MNLIGKINYQLELVKSNFLFDYVTNNVIGDYYVEFGKSDFLNTMDLMSFITVSEIKNFTYLKSINKLCLSIIELYDKELKDNYFDYEDNLSRFFTIGEEGFMSSQVEVLDKFDFGGSRSYFQHFKIKDLVLRVRHIYEIISEAYQETLVAVNNSDIYSDNFIIKNPNEDQYELYEQRNHMKVNRTNLKGQKIETWLCRPIIDWEKEEVKKQAELRKMDILTLENVEEDLLLRENIKKEDYEMIFAKNGLIVWHYMFLDFEVIESSRSDIKFMFEYMKKHKLINESVSETFLLKWINKAYQITVESTNNYNPNKNRKDSFSRACLI